MDDAEESITSHGGYKQNPRRRTLKVTEETYAGGDASPLRPACGLVVEKAMTPTQDDEDAEDCAVDNTPDRMWSLSPTSHADLRYLRTRRELRLRIGFVGY